MNRICRTCGEEKVITAFPKYARGRGRNCSLCRSRIRTETTKLLGDFRERHGRGVKMARVNRVCFNIWSNALNRSVNMGWEFNLPRSWVFGAVSEFCAQNHHSFDKHNPFLPSLDRIDRTRGYTIDNVMIVWLIENFAKNRFTEADVWEFCRRKLGWE